MSGTMTFKWVKNIYTGEKAKTILGLASAGIGYIILSSGQVGNQLEVIAAFRVAESQVPSITLTDLNEYESDKMDKILLKRQGMPGGA